MSYLLLCNKSSALEQSTFDTFHNSIIRGTDGSFGLGWILDSSSSLLSVGDLTESTHYSINSLTGPAVGHQPQCLSSFVFTWTFHQAGLGCSCDYIRSPSSKREQAPVHTFRPLLASCLLIPHLHREHIELRMTVIMSYGRAYIQRKEKLSTTQFLE